MQRADDQSKLNAHFLETAGDPTHAPLPAPSKPPAADTKTAAAASASAVGSDAKAARTGAWDEKQRLRSAAEAQAASAALSVAGPLPRYVYLYHVSSFFRRCVYALAAAYGLQCTTTEAYCPLKHYPTAFSDYERPVVKAIKLTAVQGQARVVAHRLPQVTAVQPEKKFWYAVLCCAVLCCAVVRCCSVCWADVCAGH